MTTTPDYLGHALIFAALTFFLISVTARKYAGNGFWGGYCQATAVVYLVFALAMGWTIYWPKVAEWLGV